jgi:hypothetical protein
MRSWLLLFAALLSGTAAASGHEVSLGSTTLVVNNGGVFNPVAPRWGLEAAYTREVDSWQVGGGLRWAFTRDTPVPLEFFARAVLAPRLGLWTPAVGPEVGFSGLPIVLPPRGGFPTEHPDIEAARLAPFYLAVHAAPLRFSFRHFTVSVLELQWGTTLNAPGAMVRLQLGLARVGVTL